VRGLFELRQKHLQNALDVFEYLIVPDADNTIAECVQLGVALSISRTVRMLTAINLHDDPTLATKKIHVETTDWFLADKLEPAQSAISQPEPEH
jgi:hypothetical protein